MDIDHHGQRGLTLRGSPHIQVEAIFTLREITFWEVLHTTVAEMIGFAHTFPMTRRARLGPAQVPYWRFGVGNPLENLYAGVSACNTAKQTSFSLDRPL